MSNAVLNPQAATGHAGLLISNMTVSWVPHSECGGYLFGRRIRRLGDVVKLIQVIKSALVQVICNWNESTPALLRQISKAQRGRRTFRGPVVVLANRSKGSMDQVVEQEVRP